MSAEVPGPLVRTVNNPLSPVQRMGSRASRTGIYLGIIVASLAHFSALESPRYSHIEMRLAVQEMRKELHGYFWASYDVDLLNETVEVDREQDEAEEEPEEEPVEEEQVEEEQVEELEPSPLPEPINQEEVEVEEEPDEDIYPDDPAPEAAEAPDVMTAGEDAVNLESFGIVNKDGSKSSGAGYSSSKGTANKPVYNKKARAGGSKNGTGSGKARKKKRRRRNLSRPPSLAGGKRWNCPFPPQADLEQQDRATATILVTIGPNGRALRAAVLSDPGYGFGAQAKACALAKRYNAGLDPSGKPTTMTVPVNVRFDR